MSYDYNVLVEDWDNKNPTSIKNEEVTSYPNVWKGIKGLDDPEDPKDPQDEYK